MPDLLAQKLSTDAITITLIDPFPWGMLGNCAAFPYHVLSIKSESDLLRLPNRTQSVTVVTAYAGWMRQIRSLQK